MGSFKPKSRNKYYLGHDEDNVQLNETWQQVTTIMEEAATETIGKKKKLPNRKWFDKYVRKCQKQKLKITQCYQTLKLRRKKNLQDKSTYIQDDYLKLKRRKQRYESNKEIL